MTANTAEKNNSANRISTWDGWRGLAISLVLCGHFLDIEWLWEDRMGVDVFFVLSGMLMSTILFDKGISLKDFYIRRLSRVYPVLICYVVFIYSVASFYGVPFTYTEILSSLTFMRTYLPVEPGIWSTEVAIGHLWSLNVEEHSYLLLSILTLIVFSNRQIGILLLALGGTFILLGLYKYISLDVNQFKLYLIRTESAIVFILISAGYGVLKRQYHWAGNSILTISCLMLAFLCYINVFPLWMITTCSPILLSITVNHLDNIPRFFSWFLSLPALRYLGIYSYSIYIWQQFFFEYHWAIPLPMPFVSIIAITVGILSFYVVENPIRHYINTRYSKCPTYVSRT